MKKLHLIFICTVWLAASMVPAMASSSPTHNVSESSKAKKRIIKKIAPIVVECPQGTNPRLPWQVWVTYSDGTGEWRQTRWSNAAQQTEQTEQTYLVGHKFTVDGVITGDNTTENGYPITATVTVVNKNWDVPAQPVAEPLPLTMVSITGDNRLTWNRDLDTIINTMRPGNLPELEDLEELNAMLVRARNARDASSAARQEAIDYAEMVVSYVSDGSGTRDMIDRAVKQLKATLEVRR